MTQRITKSIKIFPKIWRKVKINCAKEDIEISSYIEGLIEKDLKKK